MQALTLFMLSFFRDLFLVLPKAKIDKAYKSSKFPCGFKVSKLGNLEQNNCKDNN